MALPLADVAGCKLLRQGASGEAGARAEACAAAVTGAADRGVESNTLFSFDTQKKKISIDDFYNSTQFNKELYYNNVDTFQTVDRHIRKNVLWKHSNCIKQF
ncbi:hypothetical protein [Paenibacillus glufosinatiresistens]|uniref:hypothetical protein n=1 Tax=Paenibacillus glufosinatiresistens TaxID=3070657 RepID=UPI00286DB789|nr:hypothetical protein [Paenibacillus sp. YX.27]